MQGEIKKNVQGTNSEGKETRSEIKGLQQKEEINIQPEKNEETRMQKIIMIRRDLGTFRTTLNGPISAS